MRGRSGSKKGKTRSIVEGIFVHPPVSPEELRERLSAVDKPTARRVMLTLLRKGVVGEQDGPLFSAVFEQIGLGKAVDDLVAIAGDKEYASHVRARAMSVLSEGDPSRVSTLMERLSPEEMAPLAELSLIEMLAAIQADPEQADAVLYVLETTPPELRGLMMEQVEQCRCKAGTPAADTYRSLLGDPDYAPYWNDALQAVVEEGGARGIALLEGLRDDSADPGRHRLFQGAVLRARTRQIDPETPGQELQGTAHVGSCDGQGAFIMLSVLDNPDGSTTLADLCIRCAADVRDGFVIPRSSHTEVQELLRDIHAGVGVCFVEVPLTHAALLVQEALQRTAEAGQTVPADAQPAVSLLQRVDERQVAMVAEAETSAEGVRPRVTIKATRELLGRPEYEHWFFDGGDLDGAGVQMPAEPPSLVKAAWYKAAAKKLARPKIRARLSAMLRHMERWHRWNGDAHEAALCGRLARVTEQDCAASPLLRVMLELSVEMLHDSGQSSEEPSFGDANVRQHLKALFFQGVQTPRGRDLARLDLTEAALAALEQVLEVLPGESRPREDERLALAFALGKAFADYMIDDDDHQPVEALAKRMTRALGKASRLSLKERRRVVDLVLPALGAFTEQICAACPVACLDDPGHKVTDVFFSPTHPIELSDPE